MLLNVKTVQKCIFKIGNIFGVVPFYDFKEQKLTYKRYYKIYCVSFGASMLLITMFSYLYHGHWYSSTSHVFTSLRLLLMVTSKTVFFVTLSGSSFWNMNSWEHALKLSSYSYPYSSITKTQHLNITIIFFIVGCIYKCSLFVLLVISMGAINALSFIHNHICFFSRHLVIYSMSNAVNVIRSKYKFINDGLTDISSSVVIRCGTVRQIQELERIYMDASKLVEMVNKIFGWPVLIILAESVQNILAVLTVGTEHGLNLYHVSRGIIIFASDMAIIAMGGPFLLTFLCDAAVQDGCRLLKKCLHLNENASLLPREKQELARLQNLIQDRRPKFTAAGFFEIKRSTLLSIISVTTTYMIVILQFNFL